MLRLMAYSASRPHDEDFSMQAHEFMTKEPVTVSPDTPTPEIARLLLAHKISAAPVVDDAGTPIGMVSEGDLLGAAMLIAKGGVIGG
jgi:CBS domain-containing protein